MRTSRTLQFAVASTWSLLALHGLCGCTESRWGLLGGKTSGQVILSTPPVVWEGTEAAMEPVDGVAQEGPYDTAEAPPGSTSIEVATDPTLTTVPEPLSPLPPATAAEFIPGMPPAMMLPRRIVTRCPASELPPRG